MTTPQEQRLKLLSSSNETSSSSTSVNYNNVNRDHDDKREPRSQIRKESESRHFRKYNRQFYQKHKHPHKQLTNFLLLTCSLLLLGALLEQDFNYLLSSWLSNKSKTQPNSTPTNSNTNYKRALSSSILADAQQWPSKSAASQSQPQASNTNGQILQQLLQVFNGNESQAAELNRFKIMEIYDDVLLIGGRNIVYNISLATMREVRRIEWPPSDDDIRLCRIKGKSVEQCQNYVKVLKWFQADQSLYVCGTNAYKPRCRTYTIPESTPDYKIASESSGEGICPYQDTQEVTTLLAERPDLHGPRSLPGVGSLGSMLQQPVFPPDGHLYSATTAQFSGVDGLIHRNGMRTDQFNSRQLNLPKFVASFQYREHVYFLFKEPALEYSNCGKTIYARIGRVCTNDKGGAMGASRERWTSFAKARLNCSIGGDYPFYMDHIQAVSEVVSSPSARLAPPSSASSSNSAQATTSSSPFSSFFGDTFAPSSSSSSTPGGGGTSSSSTSSADSSSAESDVFYAVFTTPPNSIGGSAVCAYRMSDVLAAFEGPFRGQEDINHNWLPIPESRVPSPRPGTCVNDSKKLPDDYISFVRENPLMDIAVEPLWSQPLVTMASINFNFTSIAVDPQVETQTTLGAGPPMRTDVIFVGSSDGRVFKLINTHHLFGRYTGMQNPALLAAASSSSSSSAQSLVAAPSHASAQSPYSSALRLQQPAPHASPYLINNINQQYPSPQQAPLEDVSKSTIILEELHLFDAKTPIVSLAIHKQPQPTTQAPSAPMNMFNYNNNNQQQQQQQSISKLFVLSSKQLKVIPLARCERAQTCTDCLALYDPYCAWDARQGACLALGKSTGLSQHQWNSLMMSNGQLFSASSASREMHPSTSTWFPPNNINNMLNYQLQPQPSVLSNSNSNNNTSIFAWWQQCPASDPSSSSLPNLSSVGPPFKSLFSSHLQVPSRFDYASGHHLAHTSLLSFTTNQQQQLGAGGQSSQPVSECLTFCGGLYAPGGANGASMSGSSGPQSASSLTSSNVDPITSGCADYMTSHYMAAASGAQLQSLQNQPAATHARIASVTSESLYFAVIICAVFGIILGLLFGFALGRQTGKKHDSSVCSSTFDENNLYMASTGSHTTANLFGVNHGSGPNGNLHGHHQQPRYQPHHSLIQSQQSQHLLGSNNAQAGNLMNGNHPNGAHFRSQNSQNLGGALYESCDSDYSNNNNNNNQNQNQTGPNSNQFLLTLASNNHAPKSNGDSPNPNQNQGQNQLLMTVRTGALPPLPNQQQQQQLPLVNNGSTMISQTSQLTPNSLTGVKSQQLQHHHNPSMSINSNSCSTNTSCSTSATASATDPPPSSHQVQNQLYLNQQQQQQLIFQPQTTGLLINNGSSKMNGLQNQANSRMQTDPIKCKQQQSSTFQPQQHNKIYL